MTVSKRELRAGACNFDTLLESVEVLSQVFDVSGQLETGSRTS